MQKKIKFSYPTYNRFQVLEECETNSDLCNESTAYTRRGENEVKSGMENRFNKSKKCYVTNSNICNGKTIKADFFTDSQGRGILEIMEDITKGEIKLSGLVSPGATIQTVLNNAAKSQVNLNPIVIKSGTNNKLYYSILQKSTDIFYNELEKKLSNLGKDRAVCITSLNDTMHIKMAQLMTIWLS